MTQHQPGWLFVPLNAEHYANFVNGSKTFEMRKGPARWNRKTVWPGRRATVCRGYGKKERVFGTVGKVFFALDVVEIAFNHKIWQQILPGADNTMDFVKKAGEIIQGGPVVAFEIILDQEGPEL